jgi:hypothetical protein
VFLDSQEIKDCTGGLICGISVAEQGIGGFQIADSLLPQLLIGDVLIKMFG